MRQSAAVPRGRDVDTGGRRSVARLEHREAKQVCDFCVPSRYRQLLESQPNAFKKASFSVEEQLLKASTLS